MTAFKGLGTYGNAVGVVTPLDHKLADAALLAKASGNLIRPGLFWGGNATIVTGTAGMAYSIIAYTCGTTRSATAGAVIGGNDGVLSVSTTAAPGSNSRYDVVYHWHREYSLDGTDSNPVIGVIQGTAAASPSVPSLAAFPGAIALATILVPAGVTATNSGTTITQTAPFTASAGGIFPVRNQTEKLALTIPAGQHVWVIDSQNEEAWDGTNWRGGPWINGTLTAGWTSGGSAGGGTFWAPFRYRLNLNGEPEVQGQITPPAAVAPSAVFFTLPTGFRPAGQLEFPCSINTNAGRTLAGCQITAAGQMSFSAGSIQNVNLGQIVFATN